MKKNQLYFLLVIGSILGFWACQPESSDPTAPEVSLGDYLNLPETSFEYARISLPNHFLVNSPGGPPTAVVGSDNTPAGNPITNDGATLGRVLFYDQKLSANGRVACASCHQQSHGFSDPATLSTGFFGGKTRRHSMTLLQARYYSRGRFFWDERAQTLEQQVLIPFQDEVEMGLTLDQLVNLTKSQPYYSPLFKRAFGSEDITSDRIARALAQFVRSLVSYQSKYDVGRAQAPNINANFSNFTAEENIGKNLFLTPIPAGGAGCFGCHTTEAFINAPVGPQNNGLDAQSTTDRGAAEVLTPNLTGAFKTSTLRNIELTAPYMHDGRFTRLEQVVEHYNSGIQNHPNLAPPLRGPNGAPVRLNLAPAQKAALVAFLKTLTDPTMQTAEKWGNPFL